ncbi:MAG: hypothetical protein VXY99_09005, partial [Pseudomonadota bacterium]|nr:hypothetical protein [Pseudomonadota bacterium]
MDFKKKNACLISLFVFFGSLNVQASRLQTSSDYLDVVELKLNDTVNQVKKVESFLDSASYVGPFISGNFWNVQPYLYLDPELGLKLTNEYPYHRYFFNDSKFKSYQHLHVRKIQDVVLRPMERLQTHESSFPFVLNKWSWSPYSDAWKIKQVSDNDEYYKLFPDQRIFPSDSFN